MAPLLYGQEGAVGLYPVEACYYAIEVKSKATTPEIRKAITVAKSVCDLTYVPEFCVDSLPRERAIPVLFALDSTTRSWEVDRDRWRNEQGDSRYSIAAILPGQAPQRFEIPPLRIACVIGRGYGYFNRQSQWSWLPAGDDRREVLGLMAGIANSLPQLAAGRFGLPFGHYFTGGDAPPVQ